MIVIKHPLNQKSKIRIEADGFYEFDFPNHYDMIDENNRVQASVCFSKIRNNIALDGVEIQDVLTIAHHRLKHQTGPGRTREEQKALDSLEEAMLWLNLQSLKEEGDSNDIRKS